MNAPSSTRILHAVLGAGAREVPILAPFCGSLPLVVAKEGLGDLAEICRSYAVEATLYDAENRVYARIDIAGAVTIQPLAPPSTAHVPTK